MPPRNSLKEEESQRRCVGSEGARNPIHLVLMKLEELQSYYHWLNLRSFLYQVMELYLHCCQDSGTSSVFDSLKYNFRSTISCDQGMVLPRGLCVPIVFLLVFLCWSFLTVFMLKSLCGLPKKNFIFKVMLFFPFPHL